MIFFSTELERCCMYSVLSSTLCFSSSSWIYGSREATNWMQRWLPVLPHSFNPVCRKSARPPGWSLLWI